MDTRLKELYLFESLLRSRKIRRTDHVLNPKLDSRKRSTSTFGIARTYIHGMKTRESHNDVRLMFFFFKTVLFEY